MQMKACESHSNPMTLFSLVAMLQCRRDNYNDYNLISIVHISSLVFSFFGVVQHLSSSSTFPLYFLVLISNCVILNLLILMLPLGPILFSWYQSWYWSIGYVPTHKGDVNVRANLCKIKLLLTRHDLLASSEQG